MNKLYRKLRYILFISHMRYIAYAILTCCNADVIYKIMFRANLCGMASRFTMSLATSNLYGWCVPTIDYFMEVI